MINEDNSSPVSLKDIAEDRKDISVLQADAKSAEDADLARESKETADGKTQDEKDDHLDLDVDDDVALTFPQSLMEILDDEANSDIVSWLPHGRGFVVYRKKAFEHKVLPKYFSKQSKYSSFTRKLNRWGFVRVTRGPETGAYYHQFFKRGEHRLCMQMSCKNSSSKSKAAQAQAHAALASPSLAGLQGLQMAPMNAGGLGLQGLQQYQQNPLAAQLQLQQLQQQILEQELLRRAVQQEQQQRPELYTPVAAPVSQPDINNNAGAPSDQSILAQLAQIRQRNAALGGGGGAPAPGMAFPQEQQSFFK